MKRVSKAWSMLSMLIVLLVASVALSGCGNGEDLVVEGKVNVVTSFYPLYDFAKKIGGEHVEVYLLIPAGVEPHDWTPKAKDMKRIIQADVFIYNGAGFEGWVHNFLDTLDPNDGPMIVEASQGVNLIHTEHDEHEHHHDEHDDHDHGDIDPHTWLSPLQAQVIAANVKEALKQVDPDHASAFEASFANVQSQLQEIDEQLRDIVANANLRTIFVSHESFGYLARDYGLEQIGVMGLSPDAEPTPQRLKEIRNQAEELGVRYILFEELTTPELANTIAKSLGIGTLILNPIEGLTEKQQQAGEDYFSLMKHNLNTLEQALQ